jgi:hypothetical protein
MRSVQGFIYLFRVNLRESFEKFFTERERILQHKSDASIMLVGFVDKEDIDRQVRTTYLHSKPQTGDL